MSLWNYQNFARASDLLHKSDTLTFIRCGRKLRFARDEAAGAQTEKAVFGLSVAGSALHRTLRRALPYVVAQKGILDPTKLRLAYFDELDKVLAEEEVPASKLVWSRGTNADTEHRRMIAELYYFLLAAPKKIKRVLGVEEEFTSVIVRRDMEIHTGGTIDIIFETHENKLAFADYKSGKRRPVTFVLGYGYELGIYAQAIAEGVFTDNTTGEPKRYGRYPDEIYQLNCADFLPAAKNSNRKVWMKDECDFFGANPGATVNVKKGQQRGPGWYRSWRTADELPGLADALGHIVASVRVGRFPKALNESCLGCRFQKPCIAEGYGVTGAAKRRLEAALSGISPDEIYIDEDDAA